VIGGWWRAASALRAGRVCARAVDLGGHRWDFSQSIADVDPASWGGELLTPNNRWRGRWTVCGYAPHAPQDSVRPRRLSGGSVRPLSFTVGGAYDASSQALGLVPYRRRGRLRYRRHRRHYACADNVSPRCRDLSDATVRLRLVERPGPSLLAKRALPVQAHPNNRWSGS